MWSIFIIKNKDKAVYYKTNFNNNISIRKQVFSYQIVNTVSNETFIEGISL